MGAIILQIAGGAMIIAALILPGAPAGAATLNIGMLIDRVVWAVAGGALLISGTIRGALGRRTAAAPPPSAPPPPRTAAPPPDPARLPGAAW